MRTLITAIVMIPLAGCYSLIQHRAVPDPAMPAIWQQATPAAQNLAPTGWRTLSDPVLDDLIKQALVSNRDILKTVIRLQRAQLQSDYIGQSSLPQLSVSGGASIQKPLTFSAGESTIQVGGVSYQIPGNGNVRSFFVSAGLNYELDLWSRVAQLQRADRTEAVAAAADVDAAKMILITSVAQYYWHIALLDEEIAIADQSIAYAEAALGHSSLREQAGAAWADEVLQAKSVLHDKRTDLDALKQSRLAQTYALAMLLDVSPGSFTLPNASLPTAATPDIAAGLPVELLDHRPDVRAARLRLDEALYRVNASEAARYPQLILTSSINTTSTTLHSVLNNPIGSVGLNLALPFIDWQRNRIVRDITQTQYLETVVEFRDTLYKALVEVETALAARRQLGLATQAAREELVLTEKQEQLALLRYQTGVTAQQAWLDSQEKHRMAAQELSRQRVSELDNIVALYKALGSLL